MKRFLFVVVPLVLAYTVQAETLLIDNFESYTDDVDVQTNWVFSKAGGSDGLFAYLDKSYPAQGNNAMMMDVYMAEKWWYNTLRKEIPGGPLDLAEFLNVEFQFCGDSAATTQMSFNVFLYDSLGRALKFTLPTSYLSNPDWQKVTLSLDAFSQEEWDSGYGTEAPDADTTDIVAIGLMFVGDEVDQFGSFLVDDVKLNTKPENLSVENFEGYSTDDDLKVVWSYTKAGGPDGLVYSLDKTNTPPQGSACMLLDYNMPEKWWHNTAKKSFDSGALSLSKYAALEMWFFGDANATADISFTVFLYDSTGRVLKFALPTDYIFNSAWQKLTLSLDAFSEEEWDAGYGTDAPDADKNDIVAIGFMSVGNEVAQTGKFYVDDIQFVSKLASSSISGTITEGNQALAGVIVFAIDQTTVRQTVTNAAGRYEFADLPQGKQYRIGPIMKTYDFNPAATTITLFSDAVVQDFTAAPSTYNRLETTTISDQFDEAGLNSAIVYRGAREWGQGEAGNVRPIIDVTQDTYYQVNFPDAAGVEATLFAIEANTQQGATSPKFALEVGGYYSWDMLAFGQNADDNYYVEVDAYCDVRIDAPEGMFDRISLGSHCSVYDPSKPSLDAYGDSNTYRSSGGYAITFETDSGIIYARKYAPDNSKVRANERTEGYAVDFGQVTLTKSGWHRFRIEYVNQQVTFKVDGQQVAQVTDGDYPFGPAGLHYRGSYSDSPSDLVYMNHARFDNLKAGPTTEVTGVSDWMLN